jgi:hypothetical protein
MPLEEKNATCLSMVDEDSPSPPLQDHQWMKKAIPASATQQGPTLHSLSINQSARDLCLDGTDTDIDTLYNPMGDGLMVPKPLTGRTDLHIVNNLIQSLSNLHTRVQKNIQTRREEKLQDASKRLLPSQKIKKNIPEDRRQQHQEKYKNL